MKTYWKSLGIVSYRSKVASPLLKKGDSVYSVLHWKDALLFGDCEVFVSWKETTERAGGIWRETQ